VRPGFFDLAAVRETVATAREFNKPYAVVINAAPVKREDKEAPAVALSPAQFERLSRAGMVRADQPACRRERGRDLWRYRL
jgi:hypothetical protein